jgi:hypothetical protein
VLAWALWTLAVAAIAAVPLLDGLLRQAGRADLVQFTVDTIPPVVITLSAATVGAVLASRRPRHPVGWLLLAVALCLIATAAAAQYIVYGMLVRPGALPGVGYAAKYYSPTVFTALVLTSFVLLLTPTGSLPSTGWRWWARGIVAAMAVTLVAVTLAPETFHPRDLAVGSPLDLRSFSGALRVANQAGFAIALVAVVVAGGSLAARFRRARGVERQQLRWVAVAAVVAALGSVLVLAGMAVGVPGAPDLFGWAAGICMTVVPVAIGAAVLRYRLYDVDRIISRTLAYALLTLLLGGGYAGMVLGFGQLLGRTSNLAVAGATLAVAALFGPARRRIQAAVDQRFNRRKYDVGKTLEAFRARQRDAIDIDAVSAELVAVVNQTTQPTIALLWLRPLDRQPLP